MNTGTDKTSGCPPNRSYSDDGAPAGNNTSKENMIDETDGASNDDSYTYRVPYDPESNVELSTAIVRGITGISGEEPTTIEPLYFTIDPELLERFCHDGPDGGVLEFTFHGHAVRVTGDGVVTIARSAD